MLQRRCGDVTIEVGKAGVGLAEKGLDRILKRPVPDRRTATVDVLVVTLILVAKVQRRSLAEPKAERRVDPVTLKKREIAKGF